MRALFLMLAIGMLPHERAADAPPRPLVHVPAKGPQGTGVDGRELTGQNRNGKDIVASATKAKARGQALDKAKPTR